MDILTGIRSPREAALRGDPLRDRTEEAIFELARRRSIPGSRGFYYHPDDLDFRSPLFDACSIPDLLGSLVARKLALSLPELQFEPDGLRIDSAIFVRSGPLEILEFMYKDTLKRSAHSALCWLQATAEGLPDRLARSLSGTDQDGDNSEAFFRPQALLSASTYQVAPRPDILRSFSSDLKKRLLEERRVLRIDRDLLLPVHADQIERCYEIAGERLLKDAARLAKTHPSLKRGLKRLKRAEARYFQDPRSAPTARFLKRKAMLVLAATPSGETAPLAARVVRALAPAAEQAYRASTEKIDRENVERFCGELMNHGGDWRRMIRIVTAEERGRMRLSVWTALIRHPDLFAVRYERPAETVHLFISRSRQHLPALIAGMLNLRARDSWRITALKELLESNPRLQEAVLSRPDSHALYNRLLRKAYLNFLPWYVRPLVFLNVEQINRRLFERARKALNAEQRRLASRHRKGPARSARKPDPDATSNERVTAVSLALEELYFGKKTVPAVRDVARQVGERDMGRFRNLLDAFGFRVLQVGEFEESVLFFARGHKYASRVRRVKGLWPHISRSSVADDQGAAARRALRLQTYLGLSATSKTRPRSDAG